MLRDANNPEIIRLTQTEVDKSESSGLYLSGVKTRKDFSAILEDWILRMDAVNPSITEKLARKLGFKNKD